jgi:hypothetical protein
MFQATFSKYSSNQANWKSSSKQASRSPSRSYMSCLFLSGTEELSCLPRIEYGNTRDHITCCCTPQNPIYITPTRYHPCELASRGTSGLELYAEYSTLYTLLSSLATASFHQSEKSMSCIKRKRQRPSDDASVGFRSPRAWKAKE